MKNKLKQKIVISILFVLLMIGPGSAGLTEDLANISNVTTTVTNIFTDVMSMFLQPPLVIFVGLSVFGFAASKVKKMMRR